MAEERWEYKVSADIDPDVEMGLPIEQVIEARLQDLGNDGWELAVLRPLGVAGQHLWVFKRRVDVERAR